MIKWLIRLAWIFGILGLAGTIAIIALMFQGNDGESKKETEPDKTFSPAPVKADTAFEEQKKPPPATVPAEKPAAEIKDTIIDTVIIKKPEEVLKENTKPLVKKSGDTPHIKNDTTLAAKADKKIKNETVVKERKAPPEKRFTRLELKQLLTRINKATVKYNLRSHCVQIHRTTGVNNKLASSQVEQYLRSHEYTIAGRETVDAAVQGIKIGTNGQCIRLTIGSFR